MIGVRLNDKANTTLVTQSLSEIIGITKGITATAGTHWVSLRYTIPSKKRTYSAGLRKEKDGWMVTIEGEDVTLAAGLQSALSSAVNELVWRVLRKEYEWTYGTEDSCLEDTPSWQEARECRP